VKREVELERLRMAIRDNIVTPEVRADGYGAVDFRGSPNRSTRSGSFTRSSPSPKAEDISRPHSCRPPTSAGCIEASRRVH